MTADSHASAQPAASAIAPETAQRLAENFERLSQMAIARSNKEKQDGEHYAEVARKYRGLMAWHAPP